MSLVELLNKKNRKFTFNYVKQNLKDFFRGFSPKWALASIPYFLLNATPIHAEENPSPINNDKIPIEETLPWELFDLLSINGKTNKNDYEVYRQMSNDLEEEVDHLISQGKISLEDGWNKSELIEFGNKITPIFEKDGLFYKITDYINECVDEKRDENGNLVLDENKEPIPIRQRDCDTGTYFWIGFLEQHGIKANAIYVPDHCFLEITNEGETFYWETTVRQYSMGIRGKEIIHNGVMSKEEVLEKYPENIWRRANKAEILEMEGDWIINWMSEKRVIEKIITEKGELEDLTQEYVLNSLQISPQHRLKEKIFSQINNVLKRKGDFYKYKGEIEKAISYYEKVFEFTKNLERLSEDYFSAASAYLKEKENPKKALELLNKSKKADPQATYQDSLIEATEQIQEYIKENPDADDYQTKLKDLISKALEN